MSKGGVCQISADDLLKVVDDLEKIATRLRELGNTGFTTANTNTTEEKGGDSEAVQLDIDVSGIQFKQRDGKVAGIGASWGWAFAYTQDNDYHEESRVLVQAIEQYGKVQVGEYEFQLGGRDRRLLQMKKLKSK